MLDKTLESPLYCKMIQPVHPKGDQSLGVHWKDWYWNRNTNTLAIWPKELTHWKRPDAGKDWGQEEKGMTEDEMIGWHHWLSGHGFGWTPGVADGQGGLACCSSWGRKESDTPSDWTEHSIVYMYHSFLIHSSASGHLGCFHVLIIVNSVSVNIVVHVYFQFWFLQGIFLGVGSLSHVVVLSLVFKEISTLFSIVVVSVCIPTNSVRGFHFLHTIPNIYYL